LVVSVSQLGSDPSLAVGASVTASGSKLGQVLDFSKVEKQGLARYTNDAGNHVLLEVHPAATLQVPCTEDSLRCRRVRRAGAAGRRVATARTARGARRRLLHRERRA